MASDRLREAALRAFRRWDDSDNPSPEWAKQFSSCLDFELREALAAEPPAPDPRDLAIRELEELRDKLDHERRLRVKEAGDASVADSVISERSWCSAGAFFKSINEIDARLDKLREEKP